MPTKDGFYTFIYGTRVGNAPPPPFLAFRSSKAFIIATVVIAAFTVLFSDEILSNQRLTKT